METPTLVGTYRFESAENVDDYLKALGVGLVLRKVQSVARPNVVITRRADTNQWTVVFESVFKRKENTFRPLDKFEDETFDSRRCQTSVEVQDNDRLMTWQQICEDGPDVTILMAVTDTGLVMTLKSGEHSCELKFRRGRLDNPGEIQQPAQPQPQPQLPPEDPAPRDDNNEEDLDW